MRLSEAQGLGCPFLSPQLDTEPDLDPRSAQDSPGGLPKTGESQSIAPASRWMLRSGPGHVNRTGMVLYR
ncbi:unnamed protein product [Arctogadus glacialis]